MNIRYPDTPIRPVVDQLHGHEIVDNYRWLEEMDNPETQEWVRQQNQLTRGILDKLPERKGIVARLQKYLDTEKIDYPKVFDNRVFYLRRKQGQNQPILYYRFEHETDDQERIVLDPNKESNTGIVSLDWWFPSDDGKLLAYGLSKSGDEWSTLHILNIETGEVLTDQIPRCRYANVIWKDQHSFYYNRYPQPGEFPLGEENYHMRIFHHVIGTEWENDPLIFGEDLPMKVMLGIRLTHDRRYILINVQHGWRRNDIYIADFTQKELNFKPLITDLEGLFYGEVIDDIFYLFTNYNAPNYTLVAEDLGRVLADGVTEIESFQTIIPEDKNMILEGASYVNGRILVSFAKDATAYLKVYDIQGNFIADIELPTLGSIDKLTEVGASGKPYLVFQSFLYPPEIYQVDLENFRLTPWAGIEASIDPKRFVIHQKFYKSKDGIRVPMFILHRSDIVPNGKTPTVLNGYGGFNVSSSPEYNAALFPWLENGGIFVLANLRGGSEYGEDWHRAGMRENKQNVFDDFIYAAKYLIEEGYTDSQHLGIHGRSNGGLLVGAALTQEPTLFRAVACGVPLLDMLRYHKFLIGAMWTDEYGSPDIAEEFSWLYAYSPYHHVKESVEYPPVFFYTAASDSRVHPLHAMKMTASLQRFSDPKRPVLLSVEFDAGHGVGKPMSMLVNEQADIWSFMAWRLGLEIK